MDNTQATDTQSASAAQSTTQTTLTPVSLDPNSTVGKVVNTVQTVATMADAGGVTDDTKTVLDSASLAAGVAADVAVMVAGGPEAICARVLDLVSRVEQLETLLVHSGTISKIENFFKQHFGG